MSAPFSFATVRLSFPIMFEGGFADAVQVRPLFDTELSLETDEEEAALQDLATATGLPIDAILELDQIDCDALWHAYSNLADRHVGKNKMDAPYVN